MQKSDSGAPYAHPVRRDRILVGCVVAIVVGVCALADWPSVSSTATLGDLLVGFGTLALAWFTFGLGRAAQSEGLAVRAQVELEQARMDREREPYVVPAPDPGWSVSEGEGKPGHTSGEWLDLPVKNVGPGAALNVRGILKWAPGVAPYAFPGVRADILPTSLGPGEREELRINWPGSGRVSWKRVEGTLDYEDVLGNSWRTQFVVAEEAGVRQIEVKFVLLRKRRGDPVDPLER